MFTATAIDHVVLTVPDVERSVAWYHEQFGFEVLRLEEWRRGEVPFVSVRLTPASLIDFVTGERTGENVDHLAITVEGVDLDELAASGRFDIEIGPADLYGARGVGRGVYLRDPDGNLVELRTYPAS